MSTLNVEQVNTLGVTVDGDAVSGKPGYNYIINGNFDIWQRGPVQTTQGYGSDDRWRNESSGSTKTHSRQSFDIGSVFPDGTLTPKYYSRTVVVSVAGAANADQKYQLIEDVTRLAGRKCTLSFWAKADADKNMSIEFVQNFGSGGSPSQFISGVGVQKVSLTTAWKKYVITVDFPSIAGKTLGSVGDSNIGIVFWFDAGSNYNARTNSLGQQSGTFDIALVSLVDGDRDIRPIPRSYAEELTLCQRYYEIGTSWFQGYGSPGASAQSHTSFATTKRAVPTMYIQYVGTSYGNVNGQSLVTSATINGVRVGDGILSLGIGYAIFTFTADAEL